MRKIKKSTLYTDVKDIGQRWIFGKQQERSEVIEHIMALRKPKNILYPTLVHRYIVKELGFTEASEFTKKLINELAG